MKKLTSLMISALLIASLSACTEEKPKEEPPTIEEPAFTDEAPEGSADEKTPDGNDAITVNKDAAPISIAISDSREAFAEDHIYYGYGTETEGFLRFTTEKEVRNLKLFTAEEIGGKTEPGTVLCGLGSFGTEDTLVVGIDILTNGQTYGLAFADENDSVRYYILRADEASEGIAVTEGSFSAVSEPEELVTGCYDDIVYPLLVRFSDEAVFPGYTGTPTVVRLSESEYACGITVFPTEKVTDLKIFSLEAEYGDDGMTYGVGNILYESEEFTDGAVTFEMDFMDMPINGLSFKNADGETKYFAIGMNGLDGNIYFNRFNPDEFVKY